MLHDVRLFLEKYKYSAKLVSVFKRSKIGRRIRKYRADRYKYLCEHYYDRYSLMTAKETRREFTACYNSHKSMFEAVSSMLEDEFSRETLQAVISYRLAPSKEKLQRIVVSPMYFQRDILSPIKDEVFVDGGAYTGDTIIGLEKFAGGGGIGKKYTLGNRTRSTEAV